MSVLIIIATCVLLFNLQRIIYRRIWWRGLSAEVSFSRDWIVEGEQAEITEIIRNNKILPLMVLQIKFSVSKYFCFLNQKNIICTDRNYRNDIFSTHGYEEILRKHPFICVKRGFYKISSAEMISSDLFFTEKLISVTEQNSSVYVFPGPVNPDLLRIPYRNLSGTVITQRYSTIDPFEFRGIREYVPTDSIKDINWKASARSSELMVNQYHFTSSQNVTILLDISSDTFWKYEKLTEESIRIAQAVSNECIKNGIPVGLISNGLDIISCETLNIKPGASLNHGISISKSLSRIDETKTPSDILDIINNERKKTDDTGTIYVLISKAQKDIVLASYDSLCSKNKGSQWISPLHPDFEIKTWMCPNAYTYKWEVPYA